MEQVPNLKYQTNILLSYLAVGKLLHMITLLEVFAITFILPGIYSMETGSDFMLILLKSALIIYIIALPIFSQLDARSRFQNYKQIKDQIYLYGYKERILTPVLKSRCQRDAAVVAARELGFESDCKQYFRQKGYRWFHLFPDFFFQKPQFLFSYYFWKTTFFTQTYTSKIDYTLLSRTGKHDKLETLSAYEAN